VPRRRKLCLGRRHACFPALVAADLRGRRAASRMRRAGMHGSRTQRPNVASAARWYCQKISAGAIDSCRGRRLLLRCFRAESRGARGDQSSGGHGASLSRGRKGSFATKAQCANVNTSVEKTRGFRSLNSGVWIRRPQCGFGSSSSTEHGEPDDQNRRRAEHAPGDPAG
jgi:hypothetical protein